MKQGYLLRDRQERRKARQVKWITAWRIVDAQGKDLVQPWDNTRKHALENSREAGYPNRWGLSRMKTYSLGTCTAEEFVEIQKASWA